MPPRRRFSHLFFNSRTQQHHGEASPHIPITIAIQEPVPLDGARPSVAHLPDPIVRRILTFLHDLHPEDIQTVASVSSSLYEQARYVQHGHVHVDLDKSTHVLDRLDLITRLSQLPAIRTLQVSSRQFDKDQKESNDILMHLADILPAMTGLRRLDWDVNWTNLAGLKGITAVPIPASILAALPAGLRLHTSVICSEIRESHIQARDFLRRLVGNQSLCTLSVKVRFIEERDCVETMRVLKNVLLSCPNLTRLPMIDVWYPREGCIGYGPSLSGGLYCGLGMLGGERPPAFEELGMRDYPWGLEGAPQCQGYVAKGYEWNGWAETFDWSRLVRLHDVPSCLASAIAPKLTGLRELMLEDLAWLEADFIPLLISPVELMSLSGWNRVGSKPESISQFGATLRQLKIHGPERQWKGETHTFITAPDLIRLSENLPHLEHLALDIVRDEDAQEWPYEVLDAIAAFPSLRTVELWFPLHTAPPAPAPLLTITSVPHLFRYLRERNENIQCVTLHSGAPLPHVAAFFGSVLNLEPSWAMFNTVSFVCEMVYNVESSEEDGWLRVSCLDLSEDMNVQLHQRAQKSGKELSEPQNLDAKMLRLKVALDGPLDATEWEAWKNKQQLRGRQARQEKENPSTALRKLLARSFKRAWKR